MKNITFPQKLKIKRLKNDAIIVFIFLLPGVIGFLVFFLIPFLLGIYYSLTDSVFAPKFVGISNYITLFKSSSFIMAGRNTFLFTALCVPLNMLLSISLALLLNRNMYGRNFLRTLLVTPLVIPVASVVMFWQLIFNSNGVLNYYILKLNGNPIDWMNTNWALLVVIVVYLWKNIGYSFILFIAGLQNIPAEYYESASIEGAGTFRKFKSITMVYLTPTTFFVFIMSIINSFKVFREVYLMAGDYPNDSIYMLQHYMNNTFSSLDYQKLTSAAFVMAAVICLIVYILFYVERRIGESIS